MKSFLYTLLLFFSLSCGSEPRLFLENIESKTGEVVCMKAKADLGDIDAFQFSINWDENLLDYVSSRVLIEEPSTYTKINDILHFEGALTMSGSNQKYPLAPWSITDKDLCEICWNVKAEANQKIDVLFSNYNSQILVSYHKGALFGIPELMNGSVSVK